jgi:hypothetical protein
MQPRSKIKYVHEGRYVAALEVSLIEDETGWAPYLSMEDAYKLDDARIALRQGDLKAAGQFGQVYELHPVARQ